MSAVNVALGAASVKLGAAGVVLGALTIHEAQDLLRRRQVSAVELTQAYLDRIAALDGQVRAYLHVAPELALAQAQAADRRRAQGEDTPLLGVPLAIKT